MRRIFTSTILVAAISVASFNSFAQIDFNSYSNGNLGGQSGWVANADAGADIQVVNASPLSNAQYGTGGKYITVANVAGKDDYHLFNAPISTVSNTTIFMTFLVRVTSATTSNSDYSISLLNSTNLTTPAKFYVREQNGNSRRIFGISVGTTAPVFFNTGNSSTTNAFLIVIRYDIVPGANNDVMYLWVDPTLSAGEPTTASAAATQTGGEVAYGSQIDALQVYQTSTNQPVASFDDFRLASGSTSGIAWSNLTSGQSSLPVKFQTLDARTSDNSVSLKWMVASEENLSGYSVERSNDGRSFSQIAFVNASGQSEYSFVDNKPSSVSYYRIKSVDVNGRFGYSTVALVKSGSSSIVIKAFPSPVIKNLSIQHPTAVAGNSIIISSADGRVIKTIIPATGAQQTDVDLSSAKAGLYVVRFNGANGESETLKVLKQ